MVKYGYTWYGYIFQGLFMLYAVLPQSKGMLS